MTSKKQKVIKLVSISEYARHWGIDRTTAYELIKKGEITRYENGRPKLNIKEIPPVRKYSDRRKIWRRKKRRNRVK